ncbi:MAG: cytochrome b6 [Planctomycetota bacterium]|nr:MAG: cytochrome b6 [Planctomycetota bacterium]
MTAADAHPELEAGEEQTSGPDPFDDPALFALRWFLISLGVLFAAALLALLSTRGGAPAGERLGERLPAWVWLSTALLLASSATLEWARRAVRADRLPALRAGLAATTVLGVAFLCSQAAAWSALRLDRVAGAGFYVLTALHGAHVVGGLVLLVVVTRRAFAGRYWSLSHPGVRYAAHYWHFLDATWLVIVAVMRWVL